MGTLTLGASYYDQLLLDQDVFCHDLSQTTRQTKLEKRHEYMDSY